MDDSLRQAILKAVGPLLASELERPDATPLRAWLAGEDVLPIEVLTHASTFPKEEGFAVIKALAAMTLVETALFERPIVYEPQEPVWRCVSLQHIPADIALDKRILTTNERPLIRRLPALSDYAIISLARTDALDAEGRRITMSRASSSTDPLKTALAWFAMDLSFSEAGPPDESTIRWAERWSQQFEEDTDASLLAFRSFLSSARRVGVVNALNPLRDTAVGASQMRVLDAAWAVAWDEASRARVHGVCANLALDRARGLDSGSHAHMRWVLLYALHRERILHIPDNEAPVARELLDLFYQKEVDDIAAQLACSIAIKSSRLDPILREALPVMRGPISSVLRVAYSCVDRPRNIRHLITSELAGGLVAMRMLQSPKIRARLPLLDRAVDVAGPRATPAPTPILDDYETNPDLLQDPVFFESDELTPHGTRLVSPSAPIRTLTPAEVGASSGEPSESAPRPRKATPGPSTGDVHVGPPPPTEAPSEFDVLLVTNLPEDKRERADLVLASRVHHEKTKLSELLPVIDEHASTLPHTVREVAHVLKTQGDLRRSALFYEHAARGEHRRKERAQRYLELGELWRKELQSPDRALEYFIVSFTCDATNRGALSALRDIYLSKKQFMELLGVYRVALNALHQVGADQEIAAVEAELRELQSELSDRSTR